MILLVDGILAGAAHVLSGPDHLAGVAPLAVGERSKSTRSARVGWAWGLGHGLGVAVLAALGQAVLSVGDIQVASDWAERLVGLVLIFPGLSAWRRSRRLFVHEHVHRHDGSVHAHLHVHDRTSHELPHEHGQPTPVHRHHHAAFGVGLLHGLAGAGHFLGVVPSLAMSPLQASLYVGGYLLATAAVMALFGRLLGLLTRRLGEGALPRLLQAVAGASISIGIFWVTQSFGLL